MPAQKATPGVVRSTQMIACFDPAVKYDHVCDQALFRTFPITRYDLAMDPMS